MTETKPNGGFVLESQGSKLLEWKPWEHTLGCLSVRLYSNWTALGLQMFDWGKVTVSRHISKCSEIRFFRERWIDTILIFMQ